MELFCGSVSPVDVGGQDQCTCHSPGLGRGRLRPAERPLQEAGPWPQRPLRPGTLCARELLAPETLFSLMTLKVFRKVTPDVGQTCVLRSKNIIAKILSF